MRPISVFVIVVAVVIALVVLAYIRKWRLREEYSLLWLLLVAAMVLLASFEGITVWVADRLDVAYAPSILYFVALAFVAAMLFHYSLEISRLSDQSRRLAQEVSLLRSRLEQETPPAAAGDEPASAGAARGARVRRGYVQHHQRAGWWTRMLWRMPSAMNSVIRELPPWLMKGSGMPVTGSRRMFTPDVDEHLEQDEGDDARRQQPPERVADSSWPSGARATAAGQTSAKRTTAPTNPSSSPSTLKM